MRSWTLSTFFVFYFSLQASAQGTIDLSKVSRRTPVTEVVAKVLPAVVDIRTEQTVTMREYPFGSYSLEQLFFGRVRPKLRKQNRELNLGSGVIIDPTGIVLTNEHILLRASRILVKLRSGQEFEADVIGTDPFSDLAVLKIESPGMANFPYIPPGKSDDIIIGERVVAIGNSFGFNHSVSEGIVSGLGRVIESEDRNHEDFIQITAQINPGNSGGPLLNIQGSLIGINTAIYTGGEGRPAEGIGFATPIDFAKRVISDLLIYGKLVPTYLGFRVWASKGKVWVSYVDAKSNAANAGLAEGFELVSCSDRDIKRASDFESFALRLGPGKQITCEFESPQGKRVLTFKSAEFPKDFAKIFTKDVLGISLTETDSFLRVARVYPGSIADRVGLKSGDVLLQVNDSELKNLATVEEMAPKWFYRASIFVRIFRNGRQYRATIPLRP